MSPTPAVSNTRAAPCTTHACKPSWRSLEFRPWDWIPVEGSTRETKFGSPAQPESASCMASMQQLQEDGSGGGAEVQCGLAKQVHHVGPGIGVLFRGLKCPVSFNFQFYFQSFFWLQELIRPLRPGKLCSCHSRISRLLPYLQRHVTIVNLHIGGRLGGGEGVDGVQLGQRRLAGAQHGLA